MTSFKIVRSVRNVELSPDWTDSAKFNGKGRIVGENGKPITASYKGNQYRLISKKERDFTTAERIGRGFLGVVAAVCTLGFAILFFKSVRNLLTQEKAKIRFAVVVPSNSTHLQGNQNRFSLNTSEREAKRLSEQELQRGVDISEAMISEIQRCLKAIIASEESEGVKLYKSHPFHRVFSLNTYPKYIFKVGIDDSMPERYQKMIFARTVCRTHDLGLLVIPNAKLFTVEVEGKKYNIIAEKKLDLNPSQGFQEQYFEEYASSLNETIRQLAVFICKTGYSDVEWRNNPVLNDAPDQFGRRKIGLIDIEEMDGVATGLFGVGGWGRRGLVGCVTEEQGMIVKEVAEECGVSTDHFAGAYARRIEEIEEGKKLKDFYSKNNITTGSEVVQVDEDALAFPDYPDKEEELKRLTRLLVQTINRKISANSSNESVKKKRYVLIDVNHGAFQRLDTKLIEPVENAGALCFRADDEEFHNATYLGHIVNKLLELGVIFKLVDRNGHGYFIQA